MAHYQNLLVAIDPDEEDQAALRRAVYLVRRNGGRIKAFLPIFDFSYEVTSLLSQDERMAMRQSAIDQRVAWIRQLSHYYLESGVNIDIKVVWHKRYHEAVVEEIIEHNHDLLLKAAHQHDMLESVIFTPLDWHLLRKAPCAVWMVKDQPWPQQGKALVSVNLSSEDDFHDELNRKLVKESLELAAFADSTEVHLVSAYPSTSINIAIELPEFDPTVYNNAIRGQFLVAMKALRQEFSIPEELTHVEKGMPEDIIPAVAEQIHAGIVVLGTVGRTGLSAAFIGNTAERVIGHLKCDLLALKPDDTSEHDDHDDED
ncbi:universal stress protein UspE [Limnobaculum parvum]|uniref:Universal stress protein E n=1 Tax=Limnobaculum parvum TaxID=2172103 RepID=A0A2Y9TUE3_9GAMM|nr:universal stress protein UspE [Limnobaculum parvum]AWH87285.1 universal stress protein UspE [Limnobaculum parvum]